MDDVRLNAVLLQPSRQPKAVPADLECHRDAAYLVSCFLRFLSPAMQQLQQCVLIDSQLLQRLTLYARHDPGYKPTLLAQLDHSN